MWCLCKECKHDERDTNECDMSLARWKNEVKWIAYTADNTHLGRKYSAGSKKNVASRTSAEHISDAICERPPTSALIRDRVIEPYAGRQPGTKDAMIFPAPKATSSRLGLIAYPKRSAFCFAATTLSRYPTTAMSLSTDSLGR